MQMRYNIEAYGSYAFGDIWRCDFYCDTVHLYVVEEHCTFYCK